MSSDAIQPEADLYRRQTSFNSISGRAWIKRRFEFWEPCTVEHVNAAGVTVVMDNMDELKVAHDRVQQFVLERGDLVFCRHWYGGTENFAAFAFSDPKGEFLGGNPGFVISAQNEAVELEFPLYTTLRYKHALRDIFLYRDLPPPEWTIGQRVFAYFPKYMDPPLPLLFPGRVAAVQYDVCVSVAFDDKANSYVPTTLVENLDISEGDFVFSCMSHRDEIVAYREHWGPCRVVKRQGENLLLQDALGQIFRAAISQIAVLPRHHQMIDGKLERCPGNSAGASGRSALAIKMMYATHVVRSDHYLDAADDPITRSDVEALIASDPELSWSTEQWADMLDGDQVTRYYSILWRGEPTFWWYGGDLRCARPTEEELEKMIDIAIKLDANVFGPAGEELH